MKNENNFKEFADQTVFAAIRNNTRLSRFVLWLSLSLAASIIASSLQANYPFVRLISAGFIAVACYFGYKWYRGSSADSEQIQRYLEARKNENVEEACEKILDVVADALSKIKKDDENATQGS